MPWLMNSRSYHTTEWDEKGKDKENVSRIISLSFYRPALMWRVLGIPFGVLQMDIKVGMKQLRLPISLSL